MRRLQRTGHRQLGPGTRLSNYFFRMCYHAVNEGFLLPGIQVFHVIAVTVSNLVFKSVGLQGIQNFINFDSFAVVGFSV
jgi:hypothetical protein